MDEGKPPAQPKNPSAEQRLPDETSSGLEDMLRQLSAEMVRSKPTDEKVLTALEAAQRVAFQMDAARSVGPGAEAQEGRRCHGCGSQNPRGNRFCAKCGVLLQALPEETVPVSGEGKSAPPFPPLAGPHYYHHHYHHHYFGSSEEIASEGNFDQRTPTAAPLRETSKGRVTRAARFSRTETALRQLAQDWALACNTRHLDELVDLYASDAMVIRPNVPPVRSTAAIRELFFSALEAGLGEVQMEPLRVEIFGEIAYEVGRCTMLMPTATGKRREERGKYVMVIGRQAGEWKILVDCWSTDLSLDVGADARARSQNVTPAIPKGT
ncbi:MAG TPA: nuclear transport factor 2 family protein [Terriglobales bacterium]|nr:nuclear transport factor 2 family protein [Terriglobales bacterium]